MGIIALIEQGIVELVSSEASLFETNRTVDTTRREFALEILAKSGLFVHVDTDVQTRAKELNAKGMMALDALHLASAESAGADYFCTCDDKLLKKAKRLCAAGLKAVSPIELLEGIEK